MTHATQPNPATIFRWSPKPQSAYAKGYSGGIPIEVWNLLWLSHDFESNAAPHLAIRRAAEATLEQRVEVGSVAASIRGVMRLPARVFVTALMSRPDQIAKLDIALLLGMERITKTWSERSLLARWEHPDVLNRMIEDPAKDTRAAVMLLRRFTQA